MKISLKQLFDKNKIKFSFAGFKNIFKRIIINLGYYNFINNKYHNYDKRIFSLGSSSNFKLNYKVMKKENLSAYLIYNFHKIEKGLSLKNIRPNFGRSSNVINSILELSNFYIDKYGYDNQIIKGAYQALRDYKYWHKKNNIYVETKDIDYFLDKYNFLNLKYIPNIYGGSVTLKKEETFKDINESFQGFFKSRKSVRMFSEEPVGNKIIMECIQNSLYGTPSVCNRNINKVYIVDDLSKKKKILSLQNGNSGFGIDASKLLIITSKLNCFFNPTERRAPYIAGGMFAMSLIYSLHSNLLATCCLNWDVSSEKDIKLKNILGLKDETIVMLLVVGNYLDQYKVSVSKKNLLENVASFI